MTSVHPPFDTRIFHKECRTLADAGFEVTFVAPHGRDEVVEGVRIKAIPRAGSRWRRMTGTLLGVLRAALAERADIYHFHDPELIPVGLLLKIAGKRVVYDVHEDVPRQILSKDWIPAPLRRPLAAVVSRIEALVAPRFDLIVAATHPIARRFPKERRAVICNFPRLEEFAGAGGSLPYGGRSFNLVYVGGISRSRGIFEMVAAMERLNEAYDAKLLLAGRFSPPELEEEVKRLPGWRHVEYVGWQSRPGIRRLLNEARAGVAVLHPEPNYVHAYPIKVFEYMAAGLPLVVSDFGPWRELIAGADCSLFVDPLDVDAIAGACRWLIEHPEEAEAMGQRGLDCVRERYTWESQGRRLVQAYRAALRGRAQSEVGDDASVSG